MRIVLFDVGDAERLGQAIALRFEVFVDEQGVPAEEEVDAHDRDDPDAVHAIAYDAGGKTAGTGRLYRDELGRARIGRMVVRKDARGGGMGSALLEALLDAARTRGYARAVLDAQVHAIGFYARAGFEPAGERIVDAGILHQPMERDLRTT